MTQLFVRAWINYFKATKKLISRLKWVLPEKYLGSIRES